MYVSILGRQPELSRAELAQCFADVTPMSASVANFSASTAPDVQRLGGSLKLGTVLFTTPSRAWQQLESTLLQHCHAQWRHVDHKLTIGLSVYDLPITTRQLNRTALKLKQTLKKSGVSVRLLPTTSLALSTATAHHNKLGLSDNKIELLITPAERGIQVASSIGAQNITALARRDQGRPKRDAFVGMLPPKLAQIMINLAGGDRSPDGLRLLDPFCGTGVVLQEAALLGYATYGTDLSEKMVAYSTENLQWLQATHRTTTATTIEPGDAMTHHWQPPVDLVVCETYLGQPFSATPSPAKLREVRQNCNHIIGTFLDNIHAQLPLDTPLCIAVPAWRNLKDQSLTRLPLAGTDALKKHGFERLNQKPLLYYRHDQVVARDILVLKTAKKS